ncbi:D-ribose pyranase [Vagococcus acidifermentans]|uniref:D-ribose pyranase n=1 Tax=Vagococcus acidifermentans TaxID=564710 RepID=A0A430B3H9_9ENTE|nr:D-ribose pyranase [Vagococcus acidifermentans]RSU14752.1 D-ribose pyranase [Vagococcus acidifermentans]
MKKNGVLNTPISQLLSELRHTDQIVIGDCGLPVPSGVKEIDISLTLGKPGFIEVLDIIIEHMEIEEAILAEEIVDRNPATHTEVVKRLNNIQYAPHEELKKVSANAKAIIRSGENTPYANVILQAGVIF